MLFNSAFFSFRYTDLARYTRLYTTNSLVLHKLCYPLNWTSTYYGKVHTVLLKYLV